MVINCKDISNEIKYGLKSTISNIQKRYKKPDPVLYVIQVGDNQASNSYIKGKKKDCEEVGIICKHIKVPENISEVELVSYIENLNANNYDGLIVQLPLPKHIDKNVIINAIPKEKDVDGFRKDSKFVPCTPLGIMKVLERFSVAGKDCLIINRSDIVGKPLVNLLLDRDVTVTIAHSKTKNLKHKIHNADIIITAVGIPDFITKDMISSDKIFIDVSINRGESGKLCGDISKDVERYKWKNTYITPVPNGIGLLTRAELLMNVTKSWINNL